MDPTDYIQVVTFQLADLDPDEYRVHCETAAPAFTAIRGLRAKAWLENSSVNSYGGVYAWESREAMEAYVSGPLFGALRADPRLANVTTRDFGLLERPTEITRRR